MFSVVSLNCFHNFTHFLILPYPTRLTRLGLSSLQARRIKSDLCSCCKITHSLTVLDPLIYFSPRTFNVTRGHLFMICKLLVRLNSSKFSFFSRVIDHWNTLPSNTVSAGYFSSFKARLKLIRFPDKFTYPSPNWIRSTRFCALVVPMPCSNPFMINTYF